jgi:formamidase
VSRRLSAERAHNRWHPDLEPVAAVRPGESLTLETRDGIDGQLTRASVHADAGRLDRGLPHPLTGPIRVEGAEPGDLLEIEFLAYETDDFGVTAIIPGFGFLADLFPDPFVVKWELRNGFARSDELPGIAVPAEVFAGVVGVAPSHELMEEMHRREEEIAARGGPAVEPMPESAIPPSAAAGLRTIPPRETGGNMDVRDLVAGSRLYLPVRVSGALFSLGDLHFAQGDGEVCGTGIETAGAATLRFAVHRQAGGERRFPSYEAPGRLARRSFATTGLPLHAPMDLTVAAREALVEMIAWLGAAHGLAREAAYALCSVAADLRLSEVVDVPSPLVSAAIPLDLFRD